MLVYILMYIIPLLSNLHLYDMFFIGMLTITDFINILRRYYKSPLVSVRLFISIDLLVPQMFTSVRVLSCTCMDVLLVESIFTVNVCVPGIKINKSCNLT